MPNSDNVDETHTSNLVEYDAKQSFIVLNLPSEILSLILSPNPTTLDVSMLLMFAQASQECHRVVRSILAIHRPQLDYTSLRIGSEIALEKEVIYDKRSLLHRDWLIIKGRIDHQLYARSLQDETICIKIPAKNTQIIASTPLGNTILIRTVAGFDVIDITSHQQVSCKNAIFLNSSFLFDDLNSARYLMLLPDKKTLLRRDKLDFIHLTDLSLNSPTQEMNPLAFPSNSAWAEPLSDYIKTMTITPDGQYLIVVHGHFLDGVSVWHLATQQFQQRLLLPDGATKSHYASFEKCVVSHNSRFVAVVYESEKDWLWKTTLYCLQWEINPPFSQKATEIALANINRNEHLCHIAYTPCGTHFVGLLHYRDSEKEGIYLKIWNAKQGQYVYQQFFANLNYDEWGLCVTSTGDIILINAKQNQLKKLQFNTLKFSANSFKKPTDLKLLEQKKPISNEWTPFFMLSAIAAFTGILLISLSIAFPFIHLPMLVYFILALKIAALLTEIVMTFLSLRYFAGMTNPVFADKSDESYVLPTVAQQTNTPLLTQKIENTPSNILDSIKMMDEYVNTFFKSTPKEAVTQATIVSTAENTMTG